MTKSLSELMAEHNKKIRESDAKKVEGSDSEYLKKHPKANTKYLKYVTKFQDEVDYFG